jgi:hypothetical protein
MPIFGSIFYQADDIVIWLNISIGDTLDMCTFQAILSNSQIGVGGVRWKKIDYLLVVDFKKSAL